jgi:tRNA (Thr-GGU) A37 N-methylase
MQNPYETTLAVILGASLASIYFILRPHKHCALKIQAERLGRISAERKLREDLVEKICDTTGYPMLVIGHVESPFMSRRGTPRQGLLVPDSRSLIRLKKEIPKETLEGLETYSHLFIQFMFHENTNLVKSLVQSSVGPEDTKLSNRASSTKSSTFNNRVQNFAARVLPPLLNGSSLGLFATRAPHRPNSLGLSLVKIIKVDVDNRTVLVSGADLVDGTPLFDLKPWGPFDCPTCIHNVVDHDGIVGCGKKGDRCEGFKAFVPDWVNKGLSNPYVLPVVWEDAVFEKISGYIESSKSKFYGPGEVKICQAAITQILALDIRSVHRGKGKGAQEIEMTGKHATDLIGDRLRDGEIGKSQEYEVEYDAFHISFTIKNGDNDQYPDQPWILIKNVNLLVA